MLFEEIENSKEYIDIPKVPEYITDNLKYSLYEWQKLALENFLINETKRDRKIKKGEKLSPNHLMFNMATGSGKTLVMAAMILYYYKTYHITNFIFFVNQNAILGKTQDNFIHKSHTKYLFKENIIIDEKRVNIREVASPPRDLSALTSSPRTNFSMSSLARSRASWSTSKSPIATMLSSGLYRNKMSSSGLPLT